MAKMRALLAASAALLLLLAACGSSSNSSGARDNLEDSATSSSTTIQTFEPTNGDSNAGTSGGTTSGDSNADENPDSSNGDSSGSADDTGPTDTGPTDTTFKPVSPAEATARDCPAGLPELVTQPYSGRPLALRPFLHLHNATVLTFAIPPEEYGDDALSFGFVGTRDGVLWSFAIDSSGPGRWQINPDVSTSPVLDLRPTTDTTGERGLLDVVAGPKREWLYVHSSALNGESLLSAYRIDWAGTASSSNILGLDVSSRVELLRIEQPYANHNGGDIVFDDDENLYVSFGDGGLAGDPHGNGQDLSTPLGAILRLRVSPSAAPSQRLVPAPGNPYLDDNDPNTDARIWVSGARNPFRMSFDEASQTLWVADVGQNCLEEITVLALDEGGADLGWNAFEGTARFASLPSRTHREPNFEYTHDRGLCSITGGEIYRARPPLQIGALEPLSDLQGSYVWADLCASRLYAIDARSVTIAIANESDPPPKLIVSDLEVGAQTIIGIVADPAGELFVIDLADGIFRLAHSS